jgi:16S rRNA (uracil1498-N3)-methyltransferase
MHCLFNPQVKRGLREYFFDEEELKHLKALRLKVGEKIMITNGQGLSLTGIIMLIQNNFLYIDNPVFFENYGELDINVCIGMSILENRDRMEFALEKCVELGAKEFIPLITKNCERRNINIDRLRVKSLAAMKQCQRSKLITIYPPMEIGELWDRYLDFERILLADKNGERFDKRFISGRNLILVGPEGGFTKEEINFIEKNPKTKLISLGKRRLRSETAAIVMMTLLSNE